jgi:hypothetical protein
MVKPRWNLLLATGIRLVPFGHARKLSADVVAQGRNARDQIGAVLGGLAKMSRHRTEELSRVVQTGVDRQLNGLGLVTKGDLDAFERRLRSVSAPKPARANKQTPRRATG